MILLDTNVISEPLRRAPEARVINWIDAQSQASPSCPIFIPPVRLRIFRTVISSGFYGASCRMAQETS